MAISLIDYPYILLAGVLGASVDELKLISLFIFSYPLSGLLKRIPDDKPWQKNVYIISISLFYLLGIFNLWDGLFHLAGASAMAYLIAATLKDAYMPWVAFVVLMGHMSVSHLYRQARNDDSIVDITGAQMVLVMKLTAFCWNVHDGRLKDADLSDFQRERAIRRLPSLLDFAGYAFFFPALMAGPAFDYVEYTKYITTSMFDIPPGTDPALAPRRRKQRRIPRSGTPAMIKMVIGLLWILAFLKLSAIFNVELLLSDRYLEYGFLRRVITLYLFGFTSRCKYYGVWILTEGACILSGIGYAGFDVKTGRAKWDRVVNIHPIDLETAQNTRAYIGAWNLNTNNWLRNYVYLRVTPKGKKPGFRASMATFVTSAMWHGFYPGYYLTFVVASFLQNIAKNGRRYIRPFFLSPNSNTPLPRKRYYDIFTWVITQLSFSFVVSPFVLLTLKSSLLVWGRVYFYTIIGAVLSMAFFASPAKAFLIKKQKARMERPELHRLKSDREPGPDDVMFGVPVDAERELQEIVKEVRAEIERRQREGVQVPDVRALVKEKLAAAQETVDGTTAQTLDAVKKEL